MVIFKWSLRPFIRRTPCILILVINMFCVVVLRQIRNFRPSKIEYTMTMVQRYDDDEARNLTYGDVKVLTSPPSTSPGRLFYCGWDSAPSNMFPEYDFQEKMWNPTQVNSTNNDILVMGMYGPCLGRRRFFSKGGPAKIHRLFQGRILYLNGEAFGHLDPNVIHREYQVGPYSPPSEYPQNSLLVYFFAISFGLLNAYREDPIWDWIFVPEQRRTNTGRHRGVAYFATNCLKFRQQAARRISEIVPVFYGRGCKVYQAPPGQLAPLNHTDKAIQLLDDGGGKNWQQNHNFFHDFKYCLTIENNNKPGYELFHPISYSESILICCSCQFFLYPQVYHRKDFECIPCGVSSHILWHR
jgi:hypothetical protein